MEISVGHILTGVGIVIGIAAHSAAVGALIARVKTTAEAGIKENKKDIKGISDRVDKEISRVHKTLSEQNTILKEAIDSIKNFATPQTTCDAIQDMWTTRVEGLLERRNIMETRNSKEHGDIVIFLGELKQEMKDDKEKLADKLDKISECLHRLQNDKDCES